jgi:hypothetical protein
MLTAMSQGWLLGKVSLGPTVGHSLADTMQGTQGADSGWNSGLHWVYSGSRYLEQGMEDLEAGCGMLAPWGRKPQTMLPAVVMPVRL